MMMMVLIIGVSPESERQKNPLSGYKGGEARALQLLASRIEKERQVGDCSVTELTVFFHDLLKLNVISYYLIDLESRRVENKILSL